MAIIERIYILILIFSTIELTRMEVANVEKIKKAFEVRLISFKRKEIVNQIKFDNFDHYKQLKLWNFDMSRYKYDQWKILIGFFPNGQSILDISMRTDDFKYFNNTDFVLNFFFVQGFDLDSFNFDFWQYLANTILMFKNSNFFLYKNRQLLDNKDCKPSVFTKDVYLTGIEQFSFQYGIKYSTSTCKFIFKNAQLLTLYIMSLSNSFIQRNLLGFIPREQTKLNSSITYLYLEMYNVKIDKNLLDKQVFENIDGITMRGTISQIENDFYTDFNFLKSVRLYDINIRRLFSRGIEWINSAHLTGITNISNRSQIINKEKYLRFIFTFESIDRVNEDTQEYRSNNKLARTYFYPDEDFCWFKDFPFDRLVFLDPHMFCKNGCSCTQYWLLQYRYYLNMSGNYLYMFLYYLQTTIVPIFPDYKYEIEKCNFPRRLEKCNKNEYSRERAPLLSFKSALIDSQIVDFIIVILTPIVSILGIIVNIINIITIAKIDLNKTTEDQQQKTLVRFMLVYSIINLGYCVIQSLSLMTMCIEINSIFCSELYFTQFSQWFKVIFVEFIGSSLRTMSNIVYFCISVNRYILLEKESKLGKFVENTVSKLTKRKKAFWIIFILIILMGLNSHKIFIFKVMDYSLTNLFYDAYPQYFFSLPFFLSDSKFYEQSWDYLSQKQTHARSIAYEVFTFINFVLNDIVFYAIFTVVDILLVVSFKKSTEKKKNVYKDNLNNVKIQKLLTDMEQNGKRIMRVIIVNTCILLVIKVFDLFMSVSKFKIWNDNLYSIDQKQQLNNFCHLVKICSVYEELVKIAYMLHYSFSIVCFYFLNKNFRTNLKKSFSKQQIK